MGDDKPSPRQDPYDAEEDRPHIYECVNCGERLELEERPGDCPECGGEMRNISQSSER